MQPAKLTALGDDDGVRRRGQGKLSVKPSLAPLIFAINIIQRHFFRFFHVFTRFHSLTQSFGRLSACVDSFQIATLFGPSAGWMGACAFTWLTVLRWLSLYFRFNFIYFWHLFGRTFRRRRCCGRHWRWRTVENKFKFKLRVFVDSVFCFSLSRSRSCHEERGCGA